MRAIKFRGKSKLTGLFLEGNLLTDQDGETYIVWYNCHKKECLTSVYPKTIGQFTGLYDANGKEIYEGDILRDSSGFTAVVVAYKGAFRLLDNKSQIGDIGPAYNLLREYDFSIIGNICDNKDLLK